MKGVENNKLGYQSHFCSTVQELRVVGGYTSLESCKFNLLLNENKLMCPSEFFLFPLRLELQHCPVNPALLSNLASTFL